MCECCKEINQLSVLRDELSDYKTKAIIRRDRYISGMWAGEVYGSTWELNYCPMCGRNLKEEE